MNRPDYLTIQTVRAVHEPLRLQETTYAPSRHSLSDYRKGGS